MAVDDLRIEPSIPYHVLLKDWSDSHQQLTALAQKCDRQATFIAGLADFIASYETIDDARRDFILKAVAEHMTNEVNIIRERIKGVKSGATIG